jgi:hypothetical protein
MDFGFHRTVDGDRILSPALPRVAIRYHYDFIYLGDLQYIARDTHHVEEFLFLVPSGQGHVRRMLLVHFEGFLENKEGSYEYLPQPLVSIAGCEYQYERYFINVQEDIARFPGSDLARAASYVRQRAYTLAGDMTVQRFSRYVSPDRRNLFSVTFLEENESPRRTPALLNEDPAEAQALLERALASFTLLPEA